MQIPRLFAGAPVPDHRTNRAAALLPYELMAVGPHVQASVTQAVAVRAGFLDDPAFVTDHLGPAFGFDRR